MLCTSELEHLTAGGAGVVVADTARALARARWRVLIVADIDDLDDAAIGAWLARAKTAWSVRGSTSSSSSSPRGPAPLDLSVQPLSRLAGSLGDQAADRPAVARLRLRAAMWRKSAQWARVVQGIGHQFDLVEFWDCGAPAYHTLLQRLHAAPREGSQDAAGFLKPRPLIAIRTHGLHQAIHAAAAAVPAGGPGAERSAAVITSSSSSVHGLESLFRAETRALQLADVVIANSPGTGRAYQVAHDLDPRRIITISPTLGTLEAVTITTPTTTKTSLSAQSQNRRPPSPPSADLLYDHPNVLVYGKLQRVKGPDVAARALVQVMRDLASQWRGSAIFAGDDQACDVDPRKRMSECVLTEEVPPILYGRFRFTGRVRRGALGTFAAANNVRLLILPSRYETFCLAAHEAAFLGLTLVLPRLPAYDGIFVDGENALMYSGTSSDLSRVVKSALQLMMMERSGHDHLLGSIRLDRIAHTAGRISYPDPSHGYDWLVCRDAATSIDF